jgi:hypothetical protein
VTPGERNALVEAAISAAEDVATYRTPRGTMATWDDRRVGRMLARDPVIAELVPIVFAELDRLTAERAAVTAERDQHRRDLQATADRASELQTQVGGLEEQLEAMATKRSDAEALVGQYRRDYEAAAVRLAKHDQRKMTDGVAPEVGQRVVKVREACVRQGLAHAYDDKVHEITSLLGRDTHLVECGPQQVSMSQLRLAPAGAAVTCPSCAGWSDQMLRMRIDAEVYRGTQRLRLALDEACQLVEDLTADAAPAPPATMRARDLRTLVTP